MAEPIYVRNFVGGDLPPDKWDEFWLNAGTIGWQEIELDNGILVLGGEFNYGSYDEILSVCREFGLHLQSFADGKYEYDPVVTIWRPGMPEETTWPTNHEGVPVVSLRGLEAAVIRDSLNDLLSSLRRFAERPPPLTVGGQPVTREKLEA